MVFWRPNVTHKQKCVICLHEDGEDGARVPPCPGLEIPPAKHLISNRGNGSHFHFTNFQSTNREITLSPFGFVSPRTSSCGELLRLAAEKARNKLVRFERTQSE